MTRVMMKMMRKCSVGSVKPKMVICTKNTNEQSLDACFYEQINLIFKLFTISIVIKKKKV